MVYVTVPLPVAWTPSITAPDTDMSALGPAGPPDRCARSRDIA
jgi:hypothetical protein